MKIKKLLGKRIYAEIIKEEEKTAGGIILSEKTADDDRKGCRFARVIMSNVEEVPAGSKVLYHKYSGYPLSETEILFDEVDIQALVVE